MQLATVIVEHMLDDRQAQTGAAADPRAIPVDAIKALGQARDVLRRDAFAGVGHHQMQATVVGKPAYLDAALGRGIAHRVKHQIGKSAAQFFLAAKQP